jgi:hypothetical protein
MSAAEPRQLGLNARPGLFHNHGDASRDRQSSWHVGVPSKPSPPFPSASAPFGRLGALTREREVYCTLSFTSHPAVRASVLLVVQ